MEIRSRRQRRAPCRIKSRLHFPFHSEKICAPATLRIKFRRQTPHWHGQFRCPNSRRRIRHNPPPQSAAHLLFFAMRDIQINPETVRADFQFLVDPCIPRVRLQKRFCHVALPQFVAPSIGPRIRENTQLAIVTDKPHIQHLLVPKQTHLGRALRVALLAPPIAFKSNRRRSLPEARLRKPIQPHAFFQPQGIRRWQTAEFQNRSTIHLPDSVVHQPPVVLLLPTQGSGLH